MTRRLALLAAVAVLGAVGCAAPKPRPDGDDNRRQMALVVEQARRLPDVVDAEGDWSGNITTYGYVGVGVEVPAGTSEKRKQELVEELERLVWRTTVDPIESLSVGVGEVNQPRDVIAPGSHYNTEADFARLTEKYGPRPTT